MFERHSDGARRSLFFARYEASQLGSPSIELEHLLLGVLNEKSGFPSSMLPGIQLDRIRTEVAGHNAAEKPRGWRLFGARRAPGRVEIPFTLPVKRALYAAAEEAESLGYSYIGAEHLLLGLLREDASPAASILTSHGVTAGDLRARIERESPRS
jgi:ATP-dependent Clp protease ATP-binding subunit ClpC